MPEPERTPSDQEMNSRRSSPKPENIITLYASEKAQERLRYLRDGNRNQTLNESERAELDSYLWVEMFVRQLKFAPRRHCHNTSPSDTLE